MRRPSLEALEMAGLIVGYLLAWVLLILRYRA